jgi:hypothetical protein
MILQRTTLQRMILQRTTLQRMILQRTTLQRMILQRMILQRTTLQRMILLWTPVTQTMTVMRGSFVIRKEFVVLQAVGMIHLPMTISMPGRQTWAMKMGCPMKTWTWTKVPPMKRVSSQTASSTPTV